MLSASLNNRFDIFQVADICFRPECDSRFDRDTCAAMVAKVGPHLSVVMDKVVMDKVVMDMVVIGELVMDKVVIGECGDG